ncbi:MAG: thioredoxin [Candidatus Euphemobacter frigidus]|nr:thioredoxin [Candidatus Euphemobacter frigidus]
MEIKIDDANFDEQVIKSDLPVLVDIWAPWCAPCNMVAPIVEEIDGEYQGKLRVCKLNVDEGPATASRYGIRAIPTLLVFKNGQVVDQIVGVVPKESLEEKIKPHL